MPVEKRTRIELFLPLRSDLAAYQIVTDWIAEEFAYTRGGSTLTTPFAGLYASASRIDLVPDAIRILTCDFDVDSENAQEKAKLERYLGKLRQEMMSLLQEEEVWIVYHSVTRITG